MALQLPTIPLKACSMEMMQIQQSVTEGSFPYRLRNII